MASNDFVTQTDEAGMESLAGVTESEEAGGAAFVLSSSPVVPVEERDVFCA